MKKIKLHKSELHKDNGEQLTSVGVIKLVAGNSPSKALSVDEMRRRVRILDMLDTLNDSSEYLTLEDEDAKILNAAIDSFPWSSASKQLLTILDDILKAEPHSPMKLVENTN